jgi:hypothetical protein
VTLELCVLKIKEECTLGTYQIPRNVKGESRILFIFSTKALIYTGVSGTIGLIFHSIINMLGFFWVGISVLAIFAGIGFIVGTFKVPDNESFEFSRKTGGENIDDVIKRWVKFKIKKRRIYTYTKEENE